MPHPAELTLQPQAPPAFVSAVETLRQVVARPEVRVGELPAPRNIAPHSFAMSLEVLEDPDDDELAVGRFVLLHDPAGQDAWDGTWRVVAYVRAAVEPEMARDPLVPEVTWARLAESLAAKGASHHAGGGTVTVTISSRFGSMAAVPASHELELRCAWSPDGSPADHLAGFIDMVATLAGLPPDGVVSLPGRRGRS